MLAGWITTTNSRPRVSTRMWRLRPLTILPASYPLGPPASVVRTLWLSMMPRRGRGLPPGLLARGHDQQGVQRRPRAVLPQAPEVAEHRALGRELPRQEAPRTPGPQQVEDGVEHLAQVHLARPAEPARRGEVRREQRELGVRQVGGVARGRPGILPPGGGGPGHRCPSRCGNRRKYEGQKPRQSGGG